MIMAFPLMVLLGGDFSSFEVTIAIAVYNDQRLYKAVTEPVECYKCKGLGLTQFCFACKGKGIVEDSKTKVKSECDSCKGLKIKESGDRCYVCKGEGKAKNKIHALMGTLFYPQFSYGEILESDGTEEDYYTKSKSGFFAVMYGGTSYTLQERLGVQERDADAAEERINRTFPEVGRHRQMVKDRFCSMKQEGGRGTQVTWSEPAEYIEEPVMGHRRYFTLENKICRALFELAQSPPPEWRRLRLPSVVRTDREQSSCGALQSALYAAAFAIQGSNTRAAINHEIQSAGAKITKHLQRKIWDLQPSGVGDWIVQPLNIHDEIICPTHPDYCDQVTQVVHSTVDALKSKIPLLAIDWKQMKNWAEKK
jgi:hypothetical protein